MMDQAGFAYEVVDANANPDLCKKYGIMQAPTLVVESNDGPKVLANASNIIKFVNEVQHS